MTAPTKAASRSNLLSRKYFNIIKVIKYIIDATEAVKKGLFLFIIPMIIIELLWQITFPLLQVLLFSGSGVGAKF